MEISVEQYNKMAERLTELEYKEAEQKANSTSDLISRQAALDALNSINCFGWVEDSWAKVSGIIEHVPPAQQWIPCSEELPKKSGQYYVSGKGKVWICEFRIIPNFIGGWCNDVSNPIVQAWMPMPAPYEEENR